MQYDEHIHRKLAKRVHEVRDMHKKSRVFVHEVIKLSCFKHKRWVILDDLPVKIDLH